MNRVVVTGLGCFCPLGENVKDYWSALQAGDCSIIPLCQSLREGLAFKIGSQFRSYDGANYFDSKCVETLDPFSQYLTIAGREAMADAGLCTGNTLTNKVAVIAGTAAGGQVTVDEQAKRLYGSSSSRLRPMTIPRFMLNSGVSRLAREFGFSGPALTVSTACASATHAIGQAFQMVRHGQTPIALTGGSEAPFCLGYLKAWEAMRVVDKHPCRPFDRQRAGLSIGEGGAALVLEELHHARERGARIYCELSGFGMSSDAGQLTKPCAKGAALAMQRAVDDAGWAPRRVGYINAHGTGTLLNDETEAAAISEVFGDRIEQIWVNSTKSLIGHGLGASGAFEAVTTILSIHHQIVHPNLRLTDPEPGFRLKLVGADACEVELQGALSNSFAFGGLNATLAFAACQ